MVGWVALDNRLTPYSSGPTGFRSVDRSACHPCHPRNACPAWFLGGWTLSVPFSYRALSEFSVQHTPAYAVDCSNNRPTKIALEKNLFVPFMLMTFRGSSLVKWITKEALSLRH